MDLIDKQAAILRFYNATAETEVQVVTDIPAERYHVLASMSYKELCKPFVIKDIKAGHSRGQIMQKYRLSASTVRYIGFQLGILKYKKLG